MKRDLASAMRSTSAGVRPKRGGGSAVGTIITDALARSRQRGQFWNGDRAACSDTVNLHEGHDR